MDAHSEIWGIKGFKLSTTIASKTRGLPLSFAGSKQHAFFRGLTSCSTYSPALGGGPRSLLGRRLRYCSSAGAFFITLALYIFPFPSRPLTNQGKRRA